MSKFLTKNSKWFYFAFGIIMGIVILSALFYMTQYANIHVYYRISTNGDLVISKATPHDQSGATNRALFNFFERTQDNVFEKDFNLYKMIVYNFQVAMSSFNDLILIYGIIGVICFAVLLILGNHNRRIYYVSNLVGGIVCPSIISIFSIVMIVKNTILMGTFNENKELFNRVSVLQDTTYNEGYNTSFSIEYLQQKYSCNDLTYIVYDLIFGIVLLYSVFMIFYAIKKYKSTAADRAKVLEKAVQNND